MVMETSSSQSVGREFVRQYYTIQHQAPLHLHRFYSTVSSFVHGGIDQPGAEAQPVYGQQEIHKKIMQLNFRDCRAKIHQLDSHFTHDNGVVVMVSGELSNNGAPMRRFVQTFVLAQQSQKQYYVHNDLFRYLFDCDEEEELHQDVELDQELMNHVNESNYYDQPEQQPLSNGSLHIEQVPIEVAPVIPAPAECLPQSEIQDPVGPASVSAMSVGAESEDSLSEPSQTPAAVETLAPEEVEVTEEKEEEPEPVEQIVLYQSDEPKTYANMVSKKSASGPFPSLQQASGITAQGGVSVAIRPQAAQPSQAKERGDRPAGDTWNSIPQQQRAPRVPRTGTKPAFGNGSGGERASAPRDRKPDESSMDRTGFQPEGDRRRSTVATYPDNQQVFVGNLPLDVGEDELREFFVRFGAVLDLRINSKPGVKPGTGARVPNFGFVVFEDPDVVQKILSEKPIMFREQRLNVEEKKPKPRDSSRVGGGESRPPGGRGGYNSSGPGRGGAGTGFRGGRGGGNSRGGGGMNNRTNGGPRR